MTLPPAYSTRFIAAEINPESRESYTVPAGMRARVACITGLMISDDTTQNNGVTAYIGLLDGVDFPTIERWSAAAGASGSTQWRGFVVVYEHETIYAENTNAALWSVTISGYLFQGP